VKEVSTFIMNVSIQVCIYIYIFLITHDVAQVIEVMSYMDKSSDVAHVIVVTSYMDTSSDVAHAIVVMSYSTHYCGDVIYGYVI
jgi:energy-coupling factor transporter ATP-binding protein EcfA2